MRSAITQRNTPQTHLKPRYTKELPVRACAEHAHAYACAGRQTLARFARSGAPDSLRCPSFPRSLRSLGCPPFPPMPLQMRFNPLARSARSGFLPPSCSGNPCTTSSGQGKRLRNRKLTPPSPIPSDAPHNASCATRGRSPAALCWLAGYALQCARVSRGL